jgi:hypothetical protein
MRVEVYCE